MRSIQSVGPGAPMTSPALELAELQSEQLKESICLMVDSFALLWTSLKPYYVCYWAGLCALRTCLVDIPQRLYWC